MNSGLPSLLDAIFGKNDLASVSLDEMYEVVNEFPSFNAAHFFLSKKLKQQNEEAYESECRRTALYFNNAFWLQTLLDEKNNIERVEIPATVEEDITPEVLLQEEPVVSVTESVLKTDESGVSFEETVPSFFIPEPSVDEQDPGDTEKVPGTVTSFDELISKYHIEGIKPEYPVAEEPPTEPAHEVANEIPAEVEETIVSFQEESGRESVDNSGIELKEETIVSLHEEPVPEYDSDFIAKPEERIPDTLPRTEYESDFIARPEERISDTFPRTEYVSDFVSTPEESIPDIQPHSDSDQFEIVEEVVNEYGIFEEVRVRKSDLDWEAFDRPIENGVPALEAVPPEISQRTNENIVENQGQYEAAENSDEQDYESFDRPLDDSDHADADDTDFVQPDETEKKSWLSITPDFSPDEPSQQAFKRFEEEKKSVAPFDAKKAGSIVFAPYHMIDYFASQGIKLVLEDNPPDNLGKQLKSFTDWLKVMKRLPVQSASEKPDEKEADRIRHFAAHSIEERDILTESMAEVLAKQGMYENAIALYQKLSLIYPPKSAYFASRIEQLKASLP